MSFAANALDSLPDARARNTLSRLHRLADREMPGLVLSWLPQLPRLLTGRALPWHRLSGRLDDKMLPLDRTQGMFCYLQARALNARHVVEFGTSVGLSTIYLAAAVRDNGGGRVIGTEWVHAKAERAREHLAEAGLSEFVEIREGDARETLRTIDGEVDFMLNDGFPPGALEVLKRVEPRLRRGAVVVTDNVGLFRAEYAEYLRYLRRAGSGFVSAPLAMNEGTEVSVRV